MIGCVFLFVIALGISQINVVYGSEKNNSCVVIDAGHGGIDGGVCSDDGLKESDINLEISNIIKNKLEKRKINVVMTRNNDKALASGKKNDMQERKRIIQEANPQCVVSIHTNKFSNKSRNGTQVFYDDTLFSKEFATQAQSYLNTAINKKYRSRDNFEAIAGDYYITKCHKVPSIIIECGFISNNLDLQLLKDKSFKNNLAEAIADIIQTQIYKSQ